MLRVLAVVAISLLSWVFPLEAQPAKPKVVFLAFSPLPAFEASFNSALRRLGWEDGRNIIVERRYTQSGPPLSEVVVEVVRQAPDVIVAPNAGFAIALRRETTTIPIVVLVAGELVAAGLAESLARPGGNVTGTQVIQREIMGKRLEWLKEALGRLDRVAHITDTLTSAPGYRADHRRQFETLTQALHIQPSWYEVTDLIEFENGFKQMAAQQAQAVIVGGSPFMFQNARSVTDVAAKYRVPATWEAREFVRAGGLMAYGVDFEYVFARGATFVDKILRGTKPAVLPIEQSTKFELAINLKAAKALGLTIPPSVLARADEVIQ